MRTISRSLAYAHSQVSLSGKDMSVAPLNKTCVVAAGTPKGVLLFTGMDK
jgi:hypothetical protein